MGITRTPVPGQRTAPPAFSRALPSPGPVVRLLGPLVVLRRDGSDVDRSEWKTGKTADLLRLLALSAGHPVRTQLLIDRLWPDASPPHARGSLRTAASQIRRTLREHCLMRGPGTLMLCHAWVDAAVLKGMLDAGGKAMRLGQAESVIGGARAVERMYRGDFHADDDTSDWALGVRAYLASGRVRLLDDAAQCCVSVGSHREALLYANALLLVDPTVERAYRSKMRAHAELGEVGSALRVFERCRRQLSAASGGRPSSETRALHREIIAGR